MFTEYKYITEIPLYIFSADGDLASDNAIIHLLL